MSSSRTGSSFLTRRCRAAFTLTELLVAMVIAVILAAFLIVSMRTVKAAAMNTRCVSQLRQAGTAMLAQIKDNNQTLESFHGGNDANNNWIHRLFYGGYLGQPLTGVSENATLLERIDAVGSLLRCPAGPIEATFRTDSINVRGNPKRWFWQAYGLGMYRSDIPLTAVTVKGKVTNSFKMKTVAIPEPGRYILLADSAGVGPGFYQSFRISRNAGEGGVSLRHGGHANAFFLDGHLSQIDKAEALALGLPAHSIMEPKE